MKPLPALLLAALSWTAGSAEADDVDYARDVKPILVKRCIRCHGAVEPEAGLRLDTAASLMEGGDSGPVIEPGQPDDSELILAVEGKGVSRRMPLKEPPLPDRDIARLRAWVAAGAPTPADELEAARAHWSFRPPGRVEPPEVEGVDWVRGPIDRFILAPLERDGIRPSPEADRATLIRRVCLDLTGLPPTPEEVEAFALDDRPDAYERLVDRLLASPHYGERWARHWLDVARYADSNGYSIDAPREIWPYRDWVIEALNRDQPFDEFAVDQLAGDLRPDADLAQKIATGFHRNTPINQEGGIDKEQFRVESIIDRVDTTGGAFLGLTIGCARCHDHKYDPITNVEYYRIFAFLNNVDEPNLPVASPEIVAERERSQAEIDAYLAEVRKDAKLLEAQKAWETGLAAEERQKQTEEVRKAFDTPFDARPESMNEVVFAAFVDQAEAAKEHRKAVDAIRERMPKIPSTMVVRERTGDPRTTHRLDGGDYTRPAEEVTPGVPAVLPPLEPRGEAPDRLDFARWLVSGENPLTARVTVNRVWMRFFGRGIVETDDDFGLQGAPPSHPELLDWLAVEFVRDGWSLKSLHRTIVTSATYRQASTIRPDLAEVDPDNRRLARQSRVRLDAEVVRDVALASCGKLYPAIGGPGVFPPQPDGVLSQGQVKRDWKADTGPDRYRRGLYTYLWRATPHPLLAVFDTPDASRACTRRVRSNTPLQALMLLNDEAFIEFARALAARVQAEAPDDDARLERAFRICLARAPSEVEMERLAGLLDDCRADFADDREAAKAIAPGAPEGEAAERAAWATVARVLMNLDEFITRE
jgi:hypothetical protein